MKKLLEKVGKKFSTNSAPRSVLFLHHSYYHFYYLAKALRARGWDAVCANVEAPNAPHSWLYHGEDLNLFDPDPKVYRAKLKKLLTEAKSRFDIIHFAGMGYMAFHPEDFDNTVYRDKIPYDFLELRKAGVKIAYTISGCSDGISQSSFNRWSSGACDKCVWQCEPEVCSDLKNLSWGHKLETFADIVFAENNPALDYNGAPKSLRGPVSFALDSDVWGLNLTIPEKYKISRRPNEVIVFHGFANAKTRKRNGRDFKGSGHIEAAINRLESEGHFIRRLFATDIPSVDVRYVMAQADIVIDQLNYGRNGATGREAMMLGKPLICRINPNEDDAHRRLKCWTDNPIVDANEETIYQVLKEMLLDPLRRLKIGEDCRKYALEWYEANNCAKRYECVWTQLHCGDSVSEIEGKMFRVNGPA